MNPLDEVASGVQYRIRMFTNHTPRVLCLVVCLIACAAAPGQPSSFDRLRVSLLTIGHGPVIHERFGHNTLVVEDLEDGKAYSFNYGVFDFFESGFVGRFLEGRMMYWMEARELKAELEYYRQAGRAMLIQELALTPAQKRKLISYLLENAKETNRRYLYNYYTANCSTKVRDALDAALDGELRRCLEPIGVAATYRHYTLRASQYNFFIYTGLSFALGPAADRALNQWEDCFMPDRLSSHIRRLKRPDGGGLVAAERMLTEVPMPVVPPASDWTWLYLVLGGIWSAAIISGVWLRRWRVAMIAAWLWLALSATGGVFLAWAFTTSHWAAYWNQNVLLLPTTSLFAAAWWPVAMWRWNHWKWAGIGFLAVAGLASLAGLFLPLGLAMFACAGLVLVPRRIAIAGAGVCLIVVGISTVVALGLKVPLFPRQANREIIALAVPLNAALIWAGRRLLVRAREAMHESVR